ncbi:FAD-dependent oxidoreductase [Nostoc sphaeroides CHAB 2801]|uniref:flavin monoamine oxidase family protein n=1 Tax=Nostoc sphaeroides TaxID=446679 RepID=UPI001E44A1E2|nr:NAD(P)/FAD-dependent oxidoreductase [Nostoc sphaeroides]MCC5632457.1 FAD-dependent oxidoreductase [Nostoc sphaeroides CHAB 2801]
MMARTPQFRQLIHIFQKAQQQNLKSEGKPLIVTKLQAQWTRRSLLKFASLATGTAIISSGLSHAQKAWGGFTSHSQNPKIAVIGGGIAGLNAAYQLKKMGLTATVYEARNRLGGRIFSVKNAVGEGLISDLGGHFINTDHTDILELAKEFDLTLFNRDLDANRFPWTKTAYYFDGKNRSVEEIAEKLRPLAAQISIDANLLDENFEQFAPTFDSISVSNYLDRHADKIPEPFIRALIENTIRTEYGVEPQESSALQLLFNLPTVKGNTVEILGSSDETFAVEGGSSRITDSLAKALTGQIYTRMRLTSIMSWRNGFYLNFSNYYSVYADYVIIAIPLTILRTINIQVNLPQNLRQFINEVDLGSNEKLYAGFSPKVWQRENGFVQEAWTDLGFSSAWDETQQQSQRRDGALTFFLGGNQARTTSFVSSKLQGKKFVHRLEKFIPGTKDAATGRFFKTQWTLDPLTRGAYTHFKPGQLTKFAQLFYIESDNPQERQNVHVGNLVFAGEHFSGDFYGYMNGAAQTGRLAAQVVASRVRSQS